MGTRERLDELRAALAEAADLASASALLSWDQETYLPRRGVEGRAKVLGTVAGILHERRTAARVGELLAALDEPAAAGDLSADERALVREARRDYDRVTKLPAALVVALAEAESLALAAWQGARAARRFQDFAPHLTRLRDLKLQVAAALGPVATPLDALLDDFEPGTTTAFLESLFGELRGALKTLVAQVAASGVTLDVEPLRRSYDPERQRAFGVAVARAMGFDFAAGRIDPAPHPFCSGIHRGDVRLTWRAAPDDLRPAFFGIIHEAGHGLYEQGLPAEWMRSPLGEATSLGVHESQSRLWENMVARGRPFWGHFLPELHRHFPAVAAGVDVDLIHRAVNHVEPSFIRVEADELTYNLHIVLRFEIERDLFAGRLDVPDLPTAWNDGMAELLGIRPAHDADGVLQDIHWAMGAFGYFPTYTLGNLYAAQLFAAARRDLGDLDALIGRGELLPLRDWLRDKVHRHGRRLRARELIRAATGEEPSPAPFLAYVREKFGTLYEI